MDPHEFKELNDYIELCTDENNNDFSLLEWGVTRKNSIGIDFDDEFIF